MHPQVITHFHSAQFCLRPTGRMGQKAVAIFQFQPEPAITHSLGHDTFSFDDISAGFGSWHVKISGFPSVTSTVCS